MLVIVSERDVGIAVRGVEAGNGRVADGARIKGQCLIEDR